MAASISFLRTSFGIGLLEIPRYARLKIMLSFSSWSSAMIFLYSFNTSCA